MGLHLLLTGYLTNQAISPPSFYRLSSFIDNPLDQFLTTLCSLKIIPFNSADFYIDFDDDYKEYRPIIEKIIRRDFGYCRSQIHEGRLDTFIKWQLASKSLPDTADNVLLMSNLDHAFVHDSIEDFIEYLNAFQKSGHETIGSITHWQEYITEKKARAFRLSKKSLFYKGTTSQPIGTCLVNSSFFRSWWEEDFTRGMRIVRPDNPFGPSVIFSHPRDHLIPKTEFFRHLDGYGHIGILSPYSAPLRACCKLTEGIVIHRDWERNISEGIKGDLPAPFSVDPKQTILNLNSRYLAPIKTFRVLRGRGLSVMKSIRTGFYAFLIMTDVAKILVATFKHRFPKLFFWKFHVLSIYMKMNRRFTLLPSYESIKKFLKVDNS